MCVFERPWERCEPAFWLPFARIVAPERLVAVARLEVRYHTGASRDDYFAHQLPVASTYWLGERENELLGGPVAFSATGRDRRRMRDVRAAG